MCGGDVTWEMTIVGFDKYAIGGDEYTSDGVIKIDKELYVSNFKKGKYYSFVDKNITH